MIQSIYTSITNANLTPCGKKGCVIPSAPTPLLKEKYLGEFRTALEKAKVRKNLGIKDDQSITWGQLEGVIEEQKDLINYIEQKWKYETDLNESIKTVEQALDYIIDFVSNFKLNDDQIKQVIKDIEIVKQNLKTLEQNLNKAENSITTIQEQIVTINNELKAVNEKLKTINVDKNILEWIQKSVQTSQGIQLTENSQLDLKISKQELNAIQFNEDGLFVHNYQPELDEKILASEKYKTKLSDEIISPEDVGGIKKGTSVRELKGKTMSELLDIIIFPSSVRDLILPVLSYSITDQLVEVGTPNLNPTLTFTKNDAGAETSREESVIYKEKPVENLVAYLLGEYTHKGTVNYAAGEYLIDNKGQVTDKRVEAGSISTSVTITATYPWFAGTQENLKKQSLVPYNISTEITIQLEGKAIIKLPGKNTKLNSFKVDGGLGFLDVNLDSWQTSTENIGSTTYKVWTKKDAYVSNLPHKINFTLIE